MLAQAGPDGLSAGTISEKLELLPATLSFHLAHLSRAGLVHGRQEGRFVIYSIDFSHINDLINYLCESYSADGICVAAGCAVRAEAL